MPELNELTTIADGAITDDDFLLIYDVAASTAYKVAKSKFLAGLLKSGEDGEVDNLTVNSLLTTAIEFATGGATFTSVIAQEVDITFTAFSVGEVKEATVTVTGAAIGDTVILNIDTTIPDDMNIMQYGISAANTLKVRAQNVGSSGLGGATYNGRVIVIRTP